VKCIGQGNAWLKHMKKGFSNPVYFWETAAINAGILKK